MGRGNIWEKESNRNRGRERERERALLHLHTYTRLELYNLYRGVFTHVMKVCLHSAMTAGNIWVNKMGTCMLISQCFGMQASVFPCSNACSFTEAQLINANNSYIHITIIWLHNRYCAWEQEITVLPLFPSLTSGMMLSSSSANCLRPRSIRSLYLAITLASDSDFISCTTDYKEINMCPLAPDITITAFILKPMI